MNRLLRFAPGLEAPRAGSGAEGSVPTASGIYDRGNLSLVVSGAIHEISGLEVGLSRLLIVLRRNEVLM